MSTARSHPFLQFLRSDSGQALTEHALLLAAFLGGAAVFSWPYTRRLLTALATHFEAIRFVVEVPFP